MPDFDDDDWDLCNRSPCKRLLHALGRYVYGDPQTGGYVMAFMAQRRNAPVTIVQIRYCPFCGTRLDDLELGVDRYVRCKT